MRALACICGVFGTVIHSLGGGVRVAGEIVLQGRVQVVELSQAALEGGDRGVGPDRADGLDDEVAPGLGFEVGQGAVLEGGGDGRKDVGAAGGYAGPQVLPAGAVDVVFPRQAAQLGQQAGRGGEVHAPGLGDRPRGVASAVAAVIGGVAPGEGAHRVQGRLVAADLGRGNTELEGGFPHRQPDDRLCAGLPVLGPAPFQQEDEVLDERFGHAGLAAELLEEVADLAMAVAFRQSGEVGGGCLGCEMFGAAGPAAGRVGARCCGAATGGFRSIRHVFQAVAKPSIRRAGVSPFFRKTG